MTDADQEFINELVGQGVNPEFARRAVYYLRSIGVEPDTVDIVHEYDRKITTRENMQKLKEHYPGANIEGMARQYPARRVEGMYSRQDEQLLEQRRHGGYNPRYKRIPGYQRRRIERTEADERYEAQGDIVSQPSLLDRVTGKARELEAKYIKEPARRHERERYFMARRKISEHEQRLKTKYAEKQERRLAQTERELDKEAFEASPAGRALSFTRSVAGGIRGRGGTPGATAPPISLVETGKMRDMLAPSMNVRAGSPMMGGGGGGNTVILGLLTGRYGQPNRPRGHYVTVIEHGVAKRVYQPSGEPGGYDKPFHQEQQPQQPQPTPSLMERLALSSSRPYDFSLSGGGKPNPVRERLALNNAKFGFSFTTGRKMRYL